MLTCFDVVVKFCFPVFVPLAESRFLLIFRFSFYELIIQYFDIVDADFIEVILVCEIVKAICQLLIFLI